MASQLNLDGIALSTNFSVPCGNLLRLSVNLLKNVDDCMHALTYAGMANITSSYIAIPQDKNLRITSFIVVL